MADNNMNIIVQVRNINTTTSNNDTLKSDFPPLLSPYIDNIRPILDKIDQLRRLNVIKEGIPLPSIVFIGDQHTGKSSVIDLLVGSNLQSGFDPPTRVPLIMRFQRHWNPEPDLLLDYNKNTVRIKDEKEVSKSILEAMKKSTTPITLIVKKNGIPDLTIIDLPGTKTLVDDDTYLQYIKPKDSIIIEVINACGVVLRKIRTPTSMSRHVDTNKERALTVYTKCDQFWNGDDFQRYLRNDLNMHKNQIFVISNRRSGETHDEAQIREATFFQRKTPAFSAHLKTSMVGISSLARRINRIQLMIISRWFSDVIKDLDDKLKASILELDKLSHNLMSISHGMTGFMQIIGSVESSLEKILIKGEFDEDVDDKDMHGTVRLVEMLDEFSEQLHTSIKFPNNFLVEEIEVLEKTNGTRLPYLYPRSVFLQLLRRKVTIISDLPIEFVKKVFDYLETVCLRVLIDRCGNNNYPWLLSSMKKATRNVMDDIKDAFIERFIQMLETEKITDYTCDPNYIPSLNMLMGNPRDEFLKVIHNHRNNDNNDNNITMYVEGYGKMEFKHLLNVSENMINQAFDLKMRMTAYWNIALKRMVDWTALQLQFWIRKIVNKEMYMGIAYEMVVRDNGVENTTSDDDDDELPMDIKRKMLHTTIAMLRESKRVITQVMNDIPEIYIKNMTDLIN
ncbi:dynamin-related protein 4C-like [Rutidosis leptorrhynchoides]|uniref:dynamin-related protein 4C-like n=1 Tax=Rutidosis leptorrhynchoides TaxID=125765 RepID=UPI003A99732C